MFWILFCLIIIAQWQISTAAFTKEGHLILEPISDENWGNSLQAKQSKRATSFPQIKLLKKEHFLWGSPQGSGQMIYSNMTMYTKEDELVISMERFASDLLDVNCSSNMMMTFKSNATFQAAIEEWSWVNLNENHTFIIMANFEGCGPARSRKPWLVNTVSYEKTEFKVFLNATLKTREEVFHTYELDWGKFLGSTSGNASSTERRSLIDWYPSFSVDLNHVLSAEFFPNATFGPFSIAISCSDCGTSGTLQFAGHIASDIVNGLSAFTISAIPHGISVAFDLGVSLSGSLPVGGLNKAWDLGAVGIPGLTVDEVLKVGPNLNFAAGFNLSAVSGSATLASSISASIPDHSLAELDLVAKQATQIYGWEPVFLADPLDLSLAINIGLELFLQTSVDLSLECLSNGFDIGLGLKLPDINIAGSVQYDAQGVCKGSKDPFGIEIGLTSGANLEILGYDELGGTRNYFLNSPLFQAGEEFFDLGPYCLPFGSAPGGAPGDSSKPHSTTSAAVVIHPTTLPSGTAGVQPTSPPSSVSPRSCETTGDGLRYRTCPNTSASCVAIGQYPIGTLVYFTCSTPGQQINGNWDTSSWGKTADGYYVSLAYVDQTCAEQLPSC